MKLADTLWRGMLVFTLTALLHREALAEGFSLLRSVDGGASWTETTPTFKSNRVNSLHAERERIWAGTEKGLFVSKDGGATWDELSGAAFGNVQGIASTSGVIVVGTKKGIWHSRGGANWAQPESGIKSEMIRAVATDGNRFFAGTDEGAVLVSSDQGRNWRRMNDGLPKDAQVFELKTNARGELFVGLYSKGFYAFQNGSWRNLGAKSGFSILPGEDGLLLAGGNPGGIFRSEDGGETWSDAQGHPFNAPSWMFFKHRESLFYGTTGRSGLYRSTDRGKIWRPVAEKTLRGRAVVAMTGTKTLLLVATVESCKPSLFEGFEGTGLFQTD